MKNFRLLFPLIVTLFALVLSCTNQPAAGFTEPTGIYINWAAYDELSDTVPLNESLAMRQLNELIRLRELGVRVEYYLMDAFWFDEDGGYREFREESWPDGPDAWLQTCLDNNIKPGLWISTNVLGWNEKWMNAVPEWESSLNGNGKRLCLFEGGYLPDLMDAMQMWVDRGVELFKFDFADFYAVIPELQDSLSSEEIFSRNVDAFRNALAEFRASNPEVRILAYNGYGGQYENTGVAFEQTVDMRWLNVFDAMYCGDPRLADVPAFSFWRSKDIYSDHQVRQYEFNGFPLKRIDNSAFMIGTTGTCYHRGTTAWKGMLILSLARGGWANTYYGNLNLLSDADGEWFAQAQELYMPFQRNNAIRTFGGLPGNTEPYGYVAEDGDGAVITLVNPKQSFATVDLPVTGTSSLLFADPGYTPDLDKRSITLGPEQLAVVGIEEFAHEQYQLGRGEDIHIPSEIAQIPAEFYPTGKNQESTKVDVKPDRDIRVIFEQYDAGGLPARTGGDLTGQGSSLADVLIIRAEQNGRQIPVDIRYDKSIWSGLSWAAGEIRADDFQSDVPLSIECISMDDSDVEMECRVFYVSYKK